MNINKMFVGAAAVAMVFASNAFSQLENAIIPFIVNVDATINISRGDDEITMSVTGGVETIATIEADKVTSVRHGSANRHANAANLRIDSRGNLNLNLPQNNYHNATLSLYSLNGRRVMHANINETTRNFSRSNFAHGVYVLSVKGVNGNSFTTRFNHRGGAMNVNVSYDAVSNSDLRRETAAFLTSDEWDIIVTANGYVDSVYTLAIVHGENPRQDITLRLSDDDNGDDNGNEFTDSRDNQTYRTVVMPDGKTWMAENLNYETASGSWCYGNSSSNCNTYGRLYNWATAMNIDASCNTQSVETCGATIAARHQGVCPDGWYLPTAEDWEVLKDIIPHDAGRRLRASSGWNDDANGTDEYGFALLPGGGRWSNGNYDGIGTSAGMWAATEDSMPGWETNANVQQLSIYTDQYTPSLGSVFDEKRSGWSVRCVKD